MSKSKSSSNGCLTCLIGVIIILYIFGNAIYYAGRQMISIYTQDPDQAEVESTQTLSIK